MKEQTPVFELSDRVTTDICTLDPMIAVVKGVSGFNDRWADYSPAGTEAIASFWSGLGAEADQLKPESREDELALRVLQEECRLGGPGTMPGTANGSINNIACPWQNIRSSFEWIPTATADDWDDVITRLGGVSTALHGYRESIEQQRSNGILEPQRQVQAVIEQGEQTADSSTFDLLAESYAEKAFAEAGVADRLAAGIIKAKAAYAEMTEWFRTDYLPTARESDGIGAEGYIEAATSHLGTTIDPHEVYDWGWFELRRLRSELAAAADEIEAGASPQRAIHILNTDPERAAHSIDDFIQIMQERQSSALAQLEGTHFDVPEEIRSITVNVDPPGGALAAHYIPPSEDFSRPGSVWYPISGKEFHPIYQEVTTAYHEGFPGHHLQIGWQVAMRDALSRFHKLMVWYPGSGEGWALYAEHLMGELGYLEKPDYRIGLLTSQLFRTCRIVVDIGCHLGLRIPDDAPFHPGEEWSYELGRSMLEVEGHAEPAMAESEIVRYLGWPGQAISYKLGERAILELRSEFDAAGVDRRDFHSTLLNVGSLGLDLTRELVRPPA